MTPRLFAWGWPTNPTLLNEMRAKFPGLGIVHSRASYAVAKRGDIARVESADDARRVASFGPNFWTLAILGDERNVSGPSGHYLSPENYMLKYDAAREILKRGEVRTSSAGLAMAGGDFDLAYQKAIMHYGDVSGQNFRPAGFTKAREGMASFPLREWFPTIIPLRLNWWPLKYLTIGSFLHQQFCVRPKVEEQIRILMADSRNVGVGIWCLGANRMADGHWQGFHGLLDRHGRMTWQGRMVRRILSP